MTKNQFKALAALQIAALLALAVIHVPAAWWLAAGAVVSVFGLGWLVERAISKAWRR